MMQLKFLSHRLNSMLLKIISASFAISGLQILFISTGIAETTARLQPSNAPLELNMIFEPSNNVVTANTINQAQFTVPSLWWSKENYQNKLLDNWIAYPSNGNQAGRIDLIVNQQVWSLLDYLERYNFINQLGTVARNSCSKELTTSALGENQLCQQGYNLRVFNYQQEFLGAYTCNFAQQPNANCSIVMQGGNRLKLEPKQAAVYP